MTTPGPPLPPLPPAVPSPEGSTPPSPYSREALTLAVLELQASLRVLSAELWGRLDCMGGQIEHIAVKSADANQLLREGSFNNPSILARLLSLEEETRVLLEKTAEHEKKLDGLRQMLWGLLVAIMLSYPTGIWVLMQMMKGAKIMP